MINSVSKKSNISIGEKEFLSRFVVRIFIEILNYIKSSLMIPIIFYYIATIIMILVLTKALVLGSVLEPLLNFLNISSRIQISSKDILLIYGWLSLFFYAVENLMRKLFKIEIFLSTKRKFKIILFVNLLLSLIVLIIFLLLLPIQLSNKSIPTSLYVSFFVFLFSMIFSILAFVSSYIINKIIRLLQESLRPN